MHTDLRVTVQIFFRRAAMPPNPDVRGGANKHWWERLRPRARRGRHGSSHWRAEGDGCRFFTFGRSGAVLSARAPECQKSTPIPFGTSPALLPRLARGLNRPHECLSVADATVSVSRGTHSGRTRIICAACFPCTCHRS